MRRFTHHFGTEFTHLLVGASTIADIRSLVWRCLINLVNATKILHSRTLFWEKVSSGLSAWQFQVVLVLLPNLISLFFFNLRRTVNLLHSPLRRLQMHLIDVFKEAAIATFSWDCSLIIIEKGYSRLVIVYHPQRDARFAWIGARRHLTNGINFAALWNSSRRRIKLLFQVVSDHVSVSLFPHFFNKLTFSNLLCKIESYILVELELSTQLDMILGISFTLVAKLCFQVHMLGKLTFSLILS